MKIWYAYLRVCGKSPFACFAFYEPGSTRYIYVGLSICSERDQFRKDIARTIALGRAKRATWTANTVVLPWTMVLNGQLPSAGKFFYDLKELQKMTYSSHGAGVFDLKNWCTIRGMPIREKASRRH